MSNSSFINKNYFIIDSNNINSISSTIYGYAITDYGIYDNSNILLSKCDNIKGRGTYIYIKKKDNYILIKQDFNGSFGLHIYRKNNYFAISNSFFMLFDYLKDRVELTFNRDYANHMIVVNLADLSYAETMINEIHILPRDIQIIINLKNNNIEYEKINYDENKINIDTKEGIDIIDNWFNYWTNLIKSLNKNIIVDLSGGFDSRLSFMLTLKSGIDLNTININSINDSLHCHNEDYDIANQIATRYNFSLNCTENIDNTYKNIDTEEMIESCIYNKMIYHKQMYYTYKRYTNIVYHITGSSGGTIRDTWDISPRELLEQHINIIKKYYTKSTEKELINSISNILNTSFSKVQTKYHITNPESNEITTKLYKETRNRHHFGRAAVESYVANIYNLSPFLDPNIHKLKSFSQKCLDRRLLIAVIYKRYCPGLLDFKFEGNRYINNETLEYANIINKTFPYTPLKNNIDSIFILPKSQKIKKNDKQIKNIPLIENPDVFFQSIFESKTFFNCFTSYFNEDIYYVAEEYYKKNNFFPLQKCYPIIAITLILKFLEAKEYINCDSYFKAFNIFKINSQLLNNNLKNGQLINLIKDYITARIDIKLISNTANFEIEFFDNATIEKPKWIQNNGEGYVIHSHSLFLHIKLIFYSDGILNIQLKGKDIKINGHRIPFWIDYKKFICNSESLLNSTTPAWHDKPIIFKRDIKQGEVIDCYIEWRPHIDTHF